MNVLHVLHELNTRDSVARTEKSSERDAGAD